MRRVDDIPLSPAENDVARGAWRRVRRQGVKYVDAGIVHDGTVELISSDGGALDEVSEALRTPGTAVQRTQLPTPTKRDLANVFDKANEAPPVIGAEESESPRRGLSGGEIVVLLLAGAFGVKIIAGLFDKRKEPQSRISPAALWNYGGGEGGDGGGDASGGEGA